MRGVGVATLIVLGLGRCCRASPSLMASDEDGATRAVWIGDNAVEGKIVPGTDSDL